MSRFPILNPLARSSRPWQALVVIGTIAFLGLVPAHGSQPGPDPGASGVAAADADGLAKLVTVHTEPGPEDWIIFTTGNSDLPHHWVEVVEIGDDGLKWIGTFNHQCCTGGIASFDGFDWTVYNSSTHGSELGPHFYGVFDIAIDGGIVWVGTLEAGLLRFDGDTWTRYDVNNSDLPANAVEDVIVDEDGIVWAGTTDGLAAFDGEEWTVYTTANSDLPTNHIKVLASNDGVLWIGTTSGLVRYDGENVLVYNTQNSFIPANHVNDITLDDTLPERLVYIGTTGGGAAVLDYVGDKWTVIDFQSGMPTNHVHAVTVDSDGAFWFGTSGGAARWGGGESWTYFNTNNSDLPDLMVKDITIDEHGNKWIATRGGLAAYRAGGVVVGTEPPASTDAVLLQAVFPNPSTHSAEVVFTLPEPADVSLALYDLLGRRVAVLAEGSYASGRHIIALDADEVTSGVYVVRLTAGQEVAATRVTLVR